MKTTYLLPCSCGRKIPVQKVQAGQTIQCECGRSFEAPTMLEIARLERVEPDAAAPRRRPRWGVRQGMIVSGVAIILVALGLGGYCFWRRPVPPPVVPPHLFALDKKIDEKIQKRIDGKIIDEKDDLSLIETMQLWDFFRGGLERKSGKWDDLYKVVLARYHYWMGVIAIIALLGVVIIVASFFVPTGGRPARARDAG